MQVHPKKPMWKWGKSLGGRYSATKGFLCRHKALSQGFSQDPWRRGVAGLKQTSLGIEGQKMAETKVVLLDRHKFQTKSGLLGWKTTRGPKMSGRHDVTTSPRGLQCLGRPDLGLSVSRTERELDGTSSKEKGKGGSHRKGAPY